MSESRIKVLLIDDHMVVRNGMRLMLGSAKNIDVTGEAPNAHEAMELIRHTDFDVALVDINLPDRSGLELLKLLRNEKPKMAVLMLSMYAEDAYALRAFKNGAAAYLTKDCSVATVIAAVTKAAAGGKYVSAAMTEKMAKMLGGVNTVSHDALSDRELEVLKQLAIGESLVAIGEALHLSPSTVTTYRARILEKMGLKSNAELARYAFENKLIS